MPETVRFRVTAEVLGIIKDRPTISLEIDRNTKFLVVSNLFLDLIGVDGQRVRLHLLAEIPCTKDALGDRKRLNSHQFSRQVKDTLFYAGVASVTGSA